MSIPMKCPNGHQFTAQRIQVSGGRNNSYGRFVETCIECGAEAESIQGTYDHDGAGNITKFSNVDPRDLEILEAIVNAVRSSAIPRETRAVLHKVAAAIDSGEINTNAAEIELSAIWPAFASLLALAKHRGFSISTILMLVSIALQFYTNFDTNLLGEQAHNDAEKQITAVSELTRVETVQTELLAGLVKAFSEQRKAEESSLRDKPPIVAKKGISPNQGTNRHERRKAKTLQRRKY